MKNTKVYYIKKWMKNVINGMVDDAVAKVEKKRSFFAYKWRRSKRYSSN